MLVQIKAALRFMLSWLRKRQMTSYWSQDRPELTVAHSVIGESKPRFELIWQRLKENSRGVAMIREVSSTWIHPHFPYLVFVESRLEW